MGWDEWAERRWRQLGYPSRKAWEAARRRRPVDPVRHEQRKAERRETYAANRPHHLAIATNSRMTRREELAQKAREYRAEKWELRLIKVYGLKEGEYAEILARQGGVCAVCGKKPGKIRLAVDHDHKNGKVRGLLHSRCNRALGPLEFSVETLRRSIAYLTQALAIREAR